jgi:hypothetical protein
MSSTVPELVTRQSSRSSIGDRTIGSTGPERLNEKAVEGADDEDKEALKLQNQNGDDVVNGTLPGHAEKPSIPWRYKIMAWSFILFWGTGCWLAEQALGPLKATMKRELHITSKCIHWM